DNPRNPALNQLYYELIGTTNANGVYVTLDGSARLSQAALGGPAGAFGQDVSGFVNCNKGGGGGDEGATATDFFKSGLRPAQIGSVNIKGPDPIKLLVGVP